VLQATPGCVARWSLLTYGRNLSNHPFLFLSCIRLCPSSTLVYHYSSHETGAYTGVLARRKRIVEDAPTVAAWHEDPLLRICLRYTIAFRQLICIHLRSHRMFKALSFIVEPSICFLWLFCLLFIGWCRDTVCIITAAWSGPLLYLAEIRYALNLFLIIQGRLSVDTVCSNTVVPPISRKSPLELGEREIKDLVLVSMKGVYAKVARTRDAERLWLSRTSLFPFKASWIVETGCPVPCRLLAKSLRVRASARELRSELPRVP
jgi:hypothetical protein